MDADIDVVVIGGGQAGLSTGYFLLRFGFTAEDFVVVDHAPAPGGAWQFRPTSLQLSSVHGITDLPGMPFTPDGDRPAADVVPEYFAAYEQRFTLPVRRPVHVSTVHEGRDGRLAVATSAGTWQARAVVNATGTADHPFVPHYPGQESFAGRQLHSAQYRDPDEFAGKRVVVVGGGTSALQLLIELHDVADLTWVTRRPPQWRTGGFTPEFGRWVEGAVAADTRAGETPHSIVSYTGLHRSPELDAALDSDVARRHTMFDRITPDGVAWDDGTTITSDVIVWATGYRPAIGHLAPLRLRERGGGIAVDNTRTVHEPRLFFVGYGPSASTLGANRAGRVAAAGVRDLLRSRAAA